MNRIPGLSAVSENIYFSMILTGVLSKFAFYVLGARKHSEQILIIKLKRAKSTYPNPVFVFSLFITLTGLLVTTLMV